VISAPDWYLFPSFEGVYICTCCHCEREFFSRNKRAVACETCSTPPVDERDELGEVGA
jgi:hypothetical protein